MSRYWYTLLIYLSTPLVLLRLLRRGLHAPAYWRRWPERFGFLRSLPRGESLWLHAVSVGEAQAAAPLLRGLRERYPALPIVITTTTPTGSERVRELFGAEVFHFYVPYDLPGSVSRFLEKVRPQVSVIMETELWPNLYHGVRQRGIPLIVANARLSERSERGYRRVRSLMASTLRCATLVAAQTPSDARRFIALGADAQCVQVVGNLKFDIRLPASLIERAEVLRGQWGRNRSVWIAASTHEGEDERILDAFQLVKEHHPGCLLVLVPRHPERFARVASLCRKSGLCTILRSEHDDVSPQTDIFLGDSMGELVLFYAASDIAFVGGSLVPSGGHNPLEPAALGLPVLFGRHMFHFRDISHLLVEKGAARKVKGVAELADQLLRLLANPHERTAVGERGRLVVETNRGTLERLLEITARYLKP